MAQESILIVDDEQIICDLCQQVLEAAGYPCYTANDVPTAQAILATHPIDVVLCDLRIPGESGMSLLRYVQQNFPSVATIVVTGSADIATALEAVRLGAYDYVGKPFRAAELPLRVRLVLERRRLVLENREYRQRLEEKVEEQTRKIRQLYQREQERAAQLERALEEVRKAHLQAQEALLAALGLRDSETRGHCRRVMLYSSLLAHALGLPPEEILYIERGALLHDIGKLGIPDFILHKPGPLNEAEWALMRKHTIQGAAMIAEIEFLKPALPVVLYHHEKYDGTGYPYGLEGKEIPIGARVFAIVDALDAITSKRPYKKPASFEEAIREIQRGSGTHFDPDIVKVFLQIPLEKWKAIRRQVDAELKEAVENGICSAA